MDVKDHGAVDVQIKCRRALREAWRKSMKHGDINYDWDRFCSLEVCGVSVLLHLLKGQFVSFSLQLSTTATFVLPVLFRSRPTL